MTANATPDSTRRYRVEAGSGHSAVRFEAMASPCELLIAQASSAEIDLAARLCTAEAWRIEQAYSRYRDDNIVHAINHANGATLRVDDETAGLLDYAALCYELSGGLFDITSGVLRRVWRFDGSDRVPAPGDVAEVMQRVGWHKLVWQRPHLTLPAGMQIDLGGIGKEYAVDRAFGIVQQALPRASLLLNFGGDLRAGHAPPGADAWHVAVENPQGGNTAAWLIGLREGALATSGDTHRYLLHEGRRLSHILDPRTGYPVADAPHSVTVAAPTCTQAGMLSTFAMLQGAQAEAFLDAQQVRYWSQR